MPESQNKSAPQLSSNLQFRRCTFAPNQNKSGRYSNSFYTHRKNDPIFRNFKQIYEFIKINYTIDTTELNGGQKVNKSRTMVVVVSILAVALISLLLALGNNTKVTPSVITTASSQRDIMIPIDPNDASKSNYKVLCINKENVQKKFTATGRHVTCPPDYYAVPVKYLQKLLKK